jgi:hypothetical protein
MHRTRTYSRYAVFLTGPALASGIARVNSVGILGGSVSPPVMGYLRDLTGNFAGGLYALADLLRWQQLSRRSACARHRRGPARRSLWRQRRGRIIRPAPFAREAVLDKELDRDEIAPAANLDALTHTRSRVRTGPVSKPLFSLTGTEGSNPCSSARES